MYNVRVPDNSGTQSEVNQVDLVNDGQELDTSVVEPPATVNISARVAGGSSPPAHLAVGLRFPHGNIKAWQNLDAKGEAHLQQLAPGRYEVVVWNFGKPYSIAQLSSSDAEVSGHILNVLAGSTISVSLTAIMGMGNLEGFA